MLDRFKLSEEESVIRSNMFTRQVEGAQKRVEGNNYDTRKQVLQYDDVMREQAGNYHTLNAMMSSQLTVIWRRNQGHDQTDHQTDC